MKALVLLLWIPPLVYLTFSVFYYAFLAVAYFVTRDRRKAAAPGTRRYLLLIPAHNEEALIGRALESLTRVDYDPGCFEACVIADNCTDRTAGIAGQHHVRVLERSDASRKGKGFAIEWALGQVDLGAFDAVVIADADNLIDPGFFRGLDEVLDEGRSAIQCNNCLANSRDTAFTGVIHLSRTINNELYHHVKHRIGLSSYLMGNGMCFTTRLLKEHPWVTGTMAEDYEYYAKLVASGEIVGFAANSRLYHQESRGLRHASEQRLRWSAGRFEVARRYGFRLFIRGLKERSYRIVDASFPLILPNLSLMVNMTAAALLAGLVTHYFIPVPFVVLWLALLMTMEAAYFASGIYLTGMPVSRFLHAVVFAPLFLVWKGCIDLMGISGRKTGQWGRSGRL
jgi:cellulose synthase/poly-beta-1,6-N-acetylglucosamine synthase-like glycosyltransferase